MSTKVDDAVRQPARAAEMSMTIIWPIFPKNCMKMKKFWTREGREGRVPLPLRSATGQGHSMSASN